MTIAVNKLNGRGNEVDSFGEGSSFAHADID